MSVNDAGRPAPETVRTPTPAEVEAARALLAAIDACVFAGTEAPSWTEAAATRQAVTRLFGHGR